MAIPGAAGSQLGLKKEVTYGTPIAVDRFHVIDQESLKVETQPIVYRGFNTFIQRSDMRRQVVRGAGGGFRTPVTYKTMGVLLQQIFGSSVSAQVASTTEYTQTHNLDEAAAGQGVHATIQVGRSQSGGTVTPFTYDGCKVSEATFSCETDGFLMLETTWVCRTGASSGAGALSLQTASYAADNPPYAWDQATVTLGGSSRIARSWSLQITRALDNERYGLGSTLRREPLLNGEWELTGELDVEFENATDYADFVAGTPRSLTVTFLSTTNIPSASNPFKIIYTIPAVVFDGDTPTIGGEGLIRQPLPYRVVDNGTNNPITVVQHTSDTSL